MLDILVILSYLVLKKTIRSIAAYKCATKAITRLNIDEVSIDNERRIPS